MNREATENKMGTEPVSGVMLKMGIPMILSMVLQACYNIVDSMFVARIPDSGGVTNMGEYAVNALTLAFPVQMLIVAFGIGTADSVHADGNVFPLQEKCGGKVGMAVLKAPWRPDKGNRCDRPSCDYYAGADVVYDIWGEPDLRHRFTGSGNGIRHLL